MTKDAFMKLYSNVRKNFYHNQDVLNQIKDIYCRKRSFTTVIYTVIVYNRVCYTWRECKRALQQIPPEYRINLSLPFVNRANDYIYYVSLTKTFNHNGDNLKRSLAWSLQRAIEEEKGPASRRKEKVSLGRLFEEAGFTRN